MNTLPSIRKISEVRDKTLSLTIQKDIMSVSITMKALLLRRWSVELVPGESLMGYVESAREVNGSRGLTWSSDKTGVTTFGMARLLCHCLSDTDPPIRISSYTVAFLVIEKKNDRSRDLSSLINILMDEPKVLAVGTMCGGKSLYLTRESSSDVFERFNTSEDASQYMIRFQASALND